MAATQPLKKLRMKMNNENKTLYYFINIHDKYIEK